MHLCAWQAGPGFTGHPCEAADTVVVCDEGDVVQVTGAGVPAGAAAATGLLPVDEAGVPRAAVHAALVEARRGHAREGGMRDAPEHDDTLPTESAAAAD